MASFWSEEAGQGLEPLFQIENVRGAALMSQSDT